MKLHEKILVHYLTCDSPVDKEGYLYKKGERNTSYQKRWFVLKGNLLFYLERLGGEALGVIVLEGCSVQLCESDEQFAFALVFPGPGLRTYKLAADSPDGQESWIKALMSASHSYMSQLVQDLERQYEGARREAYSGASYQRCAVIGPDAERLAQGLGLGPREPRTDSGPRLQALPPTSRPCRRSPKLWPRRQAQVAPLPEPGPPCAGATGWGPGAWPGLGVEPLEAFSELHEHYGREVRELRANWLGRREGRDSGRGQEEGAETLDLIDFG
ncbi:sesquipedalian-1 [Lepisosteus oculatus]|uniref:sesquipedalian-1 n=1 Tax=Lepisosteus oculatus TaxID=7918 RepID=UPI0037246B19